MRCSMMRVEQTGRIRAQTLAPCATRGVTRETVTVE